MKARDADWERWRGDVDRRFIAMGREFNLAREDFYGRLSAMNQLRDQMNTERGRFVTRDAAEIQHVSLERRIAALELAISQVTGGEASTKEIMGRLYLVAMIVLSAVGTAVAVILATR